MGQLYLIATPIGNLEDITLRAIKVLFSVDYIACEDTRRTGQMLNIYATYISNKQLSINNLYKLKKPILISFYDEVEDKKIPEIISLLSQDKSVALVSDAGTPLISDPGFKLVLECIKRDIKVTTIPGASSVIAALTISGLPINQFLFLGYLPVKTVKRKKILQEVKRTLMTAAYLKPTIVIFESPHRLEECLNDIKVTFGDIEIVVARELTKIHEEVWRGKISSALTYISNFKGEIILLLK